MAAFLGELFVSLAPWIGVLTLVVTVHELGHFLSARAFGIAVERFSIGFGRALARWTDRWGVEWRIAAIPLGGYVRFRGDADATSSVPDKDDLDDLRQQIVTLEGERSVSRYYHFRPVWQRAIVAAAGPAANFLLAVAIFTGLLLAIGSPITTPKVGELKAGGAAERAGFRPGDVIVRMNGMAVDDFAQVQQYVMLRAGEPIAFVVRRGAQELPLTAMPARAPEKDVAGRTANLGQLGILSSADPRDHQRRRYSLPEAVTGGVRQTTGIIDSTLHYLNRVVHGQESGDQLGGPIRTAQYARALAVAGGDGHAPLGLKALVISVNLLNLAAILSVGLGFMNLMPVPVLDGGHLVFYAIEAVARRPLDARIQAASYRLGLVLIGGLMLFVTFNDVRQLSVFKMFGGLFS
jgi:regulator of sigma E protease